MMSSTLRIISAASVADITTWALTCKQCYQQSATSLAITCRFNGIDRKDTLERVATEKEGKSVGFGPMLPAPCEAVIQKVVSCEQCIMQGNVQCSQGSYSRLK